MLIKNWLKVINRLVGTENAYRMLAFGVLTAACDLITVAIMYPYLSFLLEETNFDIPWLSHLTIEELSLVMVFALVTAGVGRVYGKLRIAKTVQNVRIGLSTQLVVKYFEKDVRLLSGKNGSKISSIIVSEVDQITSDIVEQYGNIVSNGVTTLAIIVYIFWLNNELAGVAIAFVSILYWSILALIKKNVDNIGERRITANKKRLSVINYLISGVRTIKAHSLDGFMTSELHSAVKLHAKMTVMAQYYSFSPRVVIEVGFVAGMVLLLSSQASAGVIDVPVLAGFAFSALKLIPSAQTFYVSLMRSRIGMVAAESVLELLDSEVPAYKDKEVRNSKYKEIEIRNIRSRVSNGSWLLNRANLKIKRGKKIGIIGPSGSGKSSLIDILLGFQKPLEGGIYVDGVKIDRLYNALTVSLVEQKPFIVSGNLKDNIIISEPQKGSIDSVLNLAQIDEREFLDENGVSKTIEAAGLNISGGQAQRIGLARALFRAPDLLVVDEGTSALDVNTQAKILDNLSKINSTMVLVTHRAEVLSICDEVYAMKSGKLEQV